MNLSEILCNIRKNEPEEINPASMVREFLMLNGMEVSETTIDSDTSSPHCYARLQSDDLVEILSLQNKPCVRISAAFARKVPVKHFRSGGTYWMEKGQYMDFNLAYPDSLQEIWDFLHPGR
jgi:hypothetical protein